MDGNPTGGTDIQFVLTLCGIQTHFLIFALVIFFIISALSHRETLQ